MWNNRYRDEYYTNGIRLSHSRWVTGSTTRIPAGSAGGRFGLRSVTLTWCVLDCRPCTPIEPGA